MRELVGPQSDWVSHEVGAILDSAPIDLLAAHDARVWNEAIDAAEDAMGGFQIDYEVTRGLNAIRKDNHG